jgi:hypothetical protein
MNPMSLYLNLALSRTTLTLTFRSLSVLESKFSKTCRRNAILRGKGDSGFSYSGIDEIPISHLTETEKCWKVNFNKQSHLTNL